MNKGISRRCLRKIVRGEESWISRRTLSFLSRINGIGL